MIETIEKVLASWPTLLSISQVNLLANDIADALEEKFTIQRKADDWNRKVALDIEERVVLAKEKKPGAGYKILRVKVARDTFGWDIKQAIEFVENHWTRKGGGDVK